jgi:restriction system protein
MAEITVQRVGELIRSVFEILWHKPEGLSARDIISLIPETTSLSESERARSPVTNTPTYERVVRLAAIPIMDAGWLYKNEQGRWFITEDGRQACRRFTNAQDFYKEAMRLYEERRQVIPDSILAIESAQETAWEYIEKHLHQSKQIELQTMLTGLLHAMNYHTAWTAPAEKHRGMVNIVAYLDPLGTRENRVLIQIKHKGQAVTLEGLRSFSAILGQKDYGLIVSIGGFTAEALQALSTDSFQNIMSLDASSFFDLWKKYHHQLSDEVRKLLPIKAVHFLALNG